VKSYIRVLQSEYGDPVDSNSDCGSDGATSWSTYSCATGEEAEEEEDVKKGEEEDKDLLSCSTETSRCLLSSILNFVLKYMSNSNLYTGMFESIG